MQSILDFGRVDKEKMKYLKQKLAPYVPLNAFLFRSAQRLRGVQDYFRRETAIVDPKVLKASGLADLLKAASVLQKEMNELAGTRRRIRDVTVLIFKFNLIEQLQDSYCVILFET